MNTSFLKGNALGAIIIGILSVFFITTGSDKNKAINDSVVQTYVVAYSGELGVDNVLKNIPNLTEKQKEELTKVKDSLVKIKEQAKAIATILGVKLEEVTTTTPITNATTVVPLTPATVPTTTVEIVK
jgi:hypothetical protein